MNSQNITYLSICIPAFGRLEYVRNTLSSIYTKDNICDCELSDFEVIISDNDPSQTLKEVVKEFRYNNLHYHSTDSEGFMNSYHVLTYAKGYLLKLHNSQELFNTGSLKKMIKLVKDQSKKKPFIFFTSGLLMSGKECKYDNFNNFMYHLSYFSSWSNGFTIWKEDFEKISGETSLNTLFPHTSLLLTQYYKSDFIINDQKLFTTQFVKKRGGHNKFHAFSIEYPSLIDTIYQEGYITLKTRKHILLHLLLTYLPLLFFNVRIIKRESFSFDNFRKDIKHYFPFGSYYIVIFLSFIVPFKIIWRKFKLKHILKSQF
nr:glycosyltransferase [uncultured Carboxylicivirga sp.]